MRRFGREAAVIACGTATTLAVACLAALLDRGVGYPASTYIWWFMPIGGLATGAAGAAGYFLAGKHLRQPRTSRIVSWAAILAAGMFFVTTFVDWRMGAPTNPAAAEGASYSAHLHHAVARLEWNLSLHPAGSHRKTVVVSTGPLGNLGRFCLLFHSAGSLLGAMAVVVFMEDRPRCESCGVFMKDSADRRRYWTVSGAEDPVLESFDAAIASQSPRAVVAAFTAAGGPDSPPRLVGGVHRAQLVVHACPSPGCTAGRLSLRLGACLSGEEGFQTFRQYEADLDFVPVLPAE